MNYKNMIQIAIALAISISVNLLFILIYTISKVRNDLREENSMLCRIYYGIIRRLPRRWVERRQVPPRQEFDEEEAQRLVA